MEQRRKALIRLLKDANEDVRTSAAEALERLEGIQNMDSLTEKYRSGDLSIKLKVVYAMGKLRADDCLPILIHALSQEEEDLRAATIRVLGEMGDNRTLQPLLALLNDPSPTIQTMAVEALSNFQHENLVPHIIPIIDRDNKYLVIAALETLGKLNAAGAIDKILVLTENDDDDIRRTAAVVLGQIEG